MICTDYTFSRSAKFERANEKPKNTYVSILDRDVLLGLEGEVPVLEEIWVQTEVGQLVDFLEAEGQLLGRHLNKVSSFEKFKLLKPRCRFVSLTSNSIGPPNQAQITCI
jgi:hypothetical protein